MDVKEDFKLAIGWNRFNLRILGVWPDPMLPDTFMGLSRFQFLIPGALMLIFIGLPQMANLPVVWGNIDLMVENLATANIPVANAVVKLFFVWYHQNALRPILRSFTQDWQSAKTEGERTIMLNAARLAKTISVWCTVLTQLMVTVFIGLRLIEICKGDKEEMATDHIVPYPGYFPYDVRPSPIYELTCLGQILSAYCATISYTGVDSFISMLVLHTCAQFTNLRNKLEDMASGDYTLAKTDDFQRRLTWIVKRHEHLNWFSKTLEDCFNVLLLFQMIFCTIQLCFQGFYAHKVLLSDERDGTILEFFFLIVFIGFILVHLYIYCYVGEQLLVQSTGMGMSAYQLKWYNVPSDRARCVLFIMFRSNSPICLTAGKFGTFSMEMFSSIIRTSLGYLSVLLTVTGPAE